MRNFSTGDLIALGALALGFTTAIAGFLTWYSSMEKKRYGLERDFGHLQRNQKQILDGINDLLRETDRRFDTIDRDILEIKAVLRFPKTD